jgi:Protein of unknown function (DUF3040)
MSLPASEARVLTRIEEGLLSRDPRLRSLFAIFTRLTWQEAMPAREQLRRSRWRPGRGAVVLLALMLTVVGVVVASLAVPGRVCSPIQREQTVASATAHACTPATSSGAPLP